MKYLGLLIIVFLAGCTSSNDALHNDDRLFPLAAGNSWRYASEEYFRGALIAKDTITISVLKIDSSINSWLIQRYSSYGTDSFFVKEVNHHNYLFARSKQNPDSNLILAYSQQPMALLLSTKADRLTSLNSTSTIADSTFRGIPTARVLQHFDLLDGSGFVILKLDFEHAFAEGIGQVYARFVADITQCQVCTLASEFSTYELISYHIQ